MKRIIDISQPTLAVRESALGRDVFERFEAEPDTLAIAVVNADGRPLGLVVRNDFLAGMASQYGHALWAGRAVAMSMNSDPIIVDGSMSVADFCGLHLHERPSELLQGFIVTSHGRYVGVGTALGLLQAAGQAARAHAAEMEKLAQKAQDASEAKSRFLAVMSHEIRTPLNGVLGVAEIVRRKATQPELTPLIDTILESGRTLLRLLNDALDLSRAEASALELTTEPMALAELLEDVTGLWAPHAELKGLTLTGHYEGPADLVVSADRHRLRQVFNNLVGNALKFTNAGEIQVRLRAEPDGDSVLVTGEVADQGPGIPPSMREDVFAPFQQTESGAQLGGAGLGLAVCRQIIERTGGSIVAQQNPGGGALIVFETRLDVVAAPDEKLKGGADTHEANYNYNVAIVDDNPTNLLVASTLCEMFGCSSETFTDALSAIAAIETGRFDLVLMDIKMPGIDGVEATRRIRSGAGAAAHIPIVAQTANADPADAAFYRACGMNAVVEKPLNPERLFLAMRDLLHNDDRLLAQVA